jgi:xylan 1,4-beta-xylosidase
MAALVTALGVAALAAAAAAAAASVQATVDLSVAGRQLNRGWLAVGSCHATTALRADWQRQLAAARADLGVEFVRFHGVFDDDMSVVLSDGFSFFDANTVFDFIVSIGMRPVVELSFMPALLASGNSTIFHYKGNTSPPADFKAWYELVYAFAGNLVARFGEGEVSRWYFEVWNEPNLDFWSGTQAQYFQLYEVSAAAIKAVSPALRVGGPATAQTAWLPAFLQWAASAQAPVDFVSTHLYPTDPNVPQTYATAFSDVVAAAAQQAAGVPLLLTEYNAGLGIDVLDYSYAAAFVAKQLEYLQDAPNLALWSYWTFTDIFEEGGQSSQPFSNQFGLQTINQVPKPAYRAFQLLHQLAGQQILTDRDAVAQQPPPNATTVDVWVTRRAEGAAAATYSAFITNFNLFGLPIAAANLSISFALPAGAAPPASALVYTIDAASGNPRALWQSWGAPTYPSPAQVAQLCAASQAAEWTLPLAPAGPGAVAASLTLQPQSLNVVTFVVAQ